MTKKKKIDEQLTLIRFFDIDVNLKGFCSSYEQTAPLGLGYH